MGNIKISQVCGLCSGCSHAINTAITELNNGKKITIFKDIVHNQNVNNKLLSLGATFEDKIENLNPNNTIIIRAHGEPPQTFQILKAMNANYKDCTCHNVKEIHNLVIEHYNKGYQIVIIGKHKNNLHPEVLGTMGYANGRYILVENEDDLARVETLKNEKVYLVCHYILQIQKHQTVCTIVQ